MWPYPARTSAAGSLAGGVGTGAGVIVLCSCCRVTSRPEGPRSRCHHTERIRPPPPGRVSIPCSVSIRRGTPLSGRRRTACAVAPCQGRSRQPFSQLSCASFQAKTRLLGPRHWVRSITPRSAPRSMYMAPPCCLACDLVEPLASSAIAEPGGAYYRSICDNA